MSKFPVTMSLNGNEIIQSSQKLEKNKWDTECNTVSVAGSLSRVFQGPWVVQTPILQSRITETHNSLLHLRVELALLIPAPLWEQCALHFWTGAGTQLLPTKSFGQADRQQVQCFCGTAKDPSKGLRDGSLHKKTIFVPTIHKKTHVCAQIQVIPGWDCFPPCKGLFSPPEHLLETSTCLTLWKLSY